MSQAQPTPRSNREAAARGAAAITDLTRRRRQQRASKALGPPVDGKQARPAKAAAVDAKTGDGFWPPPAAPAGLRLGRGARLWPGRPAAPLDHTGGWQG